MIKKIDAQKIANSMNVAARNLVRPFVLVNTELDEIEFEDTARRRLDVFLSEHDKTRGDEWDDLDDLWSSAIWKAMWREYRLIRVSGGNTGSSAVN